MNRLLKLEEVGQLLLSIILFDRMEYPWWLFPALLLAPDIGMIGYLISPVKGAASYNLTHHKGLGVALYAVGLLAGSEPLALAGLIIFGHSSLDRALGYGLKHPDSFQHTHLGWIGRTGREPQA
jgi:hypothetical protein